MTEGLGGRAAKGALVTVGAQAFRIVLQIVSIAALARLLQPRDYGLLAMVVAIIGVGELVRDFGLSSAAIQAPTLSDPQRTNLFWISTAIGLALAVVVAAGAGVLPRLYGEPELAGIAQALAVTFLLNGAATQYRAGLIRSMRFKALAIVDVAAPTCAFAVALVLAWSGAGYWAIVAQYLTVALVGLVAAAAFGRWRPGLPRRGVAIRPFIRFGGNLLGSQLLGYLGNNVDSLIVGVRFGADQLGFYSRAFSLLMTPLAQLRAPSTTVALPVLSRVRDEDARFSRFVMTGQLALAYPLALALAVVIGAAPAVVDLLLGQGWSPVAPLIRLLAVAGVFQTLSFVGYWVYLSRGLTDQLLRYTVVSVSIKVVAIVVGSSWGPVGVAAGFAVAPMIAWPISLWWLSRITPIPTQALYGGALRILGAAAIVAAVSAGVSSLASGRGLVLQVVLAAGSSALAFAALATSAPPIRRDVGVVAGVLGKAFKKGLSDQ